MKNEAKVNCLWILDFFFMLIQSHVERSENHIVIWAGTSHLRAPPSARAFYPRPHLNMHMGSHTQRHHCPLGFSSLSPLPFVLVFTEQGFGDTSGQEWTTFLPTFWAFLSLPPASVYHHYPPAYDRSCYENAASPPCPGCLDRSLTALAPLKIWNWPIDYEVQELLVTMQLSAQ